MDSTLFPVEEVSQQTLSVVPKTEEKAEIMPDLWKLEFRPPYITKDSLKQFSFSRKEYNYPGIVLFKRENKIFDIRFTDDSIYSQIIKRLPFNGTDCLVAVYKVQKRDFEAFADYKKRIRDYYYHFYRQRAKVPLISGQYERIMQMLSKSDVTREDILSYLDFKEPYEDLLSNPRVRTFKRDKFMWRPGIYFFRQNYEEISYIGKGQDWYSRFYSHFSPYACFEPDRPDKKLVHYHTLLGRVPLQGAFIDVPGTIAVGGVTIELGYDQIEKLCLALEDKLITLFDPIDNRPEEVLPANNLFDKTADYPF
jgi:hypothetical protein